MNNTVQRNPDTGDFTVHSEQSFTDMARNNPDAMIAYLESDADAGRLTHAVEIAGREMQGTRVVQALVKLMKHPRPVVREGAILGLWNHFSDPKARAAVELASKEDECETIRQVAAGALL